MRSNQQTSTAVLQLGTAALGVVVSFILFAAYMVIPLAGFFSGLLAPFPAAFFRLRQGTGTAVIITLGTITLLTAAFGIQAGLLYLVQCGVIALVMPELLVRDVGAARAITWTTAVNVSVLAMATLAYGVISGQNIHALAIKEINTSIAQTITIYEHAGVKGDDLIPIKQSMTMVAALFSKIYPALLTVVLAMATACNLALIKRAATRIGIELNIGNFNDFRNRDSLIWLLIAAGFAMLAGNPIITIPALNVLVLVTTLYFLQGLAAILTIIARQAFVGVLRVMLFMMLLFQPYLVALVAAFGIFDLWGDFRTPRKQENL